MATGYIPVLGRVNRENVTRRALAAKTLWVDPEGNVWKLKKGTLKMVNPAWNGRNRDRYQNIWIPDPDDPRRAAQMYLHRVAYIAQHGYIPDDMTIDHYNGDRKNNTSENLRIVTQEENSTHAYEVGDKVAYIMGYRLWRAEILAEYESSDDPEIIKKIAARENRTIRTIQEILRKARKERAAGLSPV